jgi:hypothetical protein
MFSIFLCDSFLMLMFPYDVLNASAARSTYCCKYKLMFSICICVSFLILTFPYDVLNASTARSIYYCKYKLMLAIFLCVSFLLLTFLYNFISIADVYDFSNASAAPEIVKTNCPRHNRNRYSTNKYTWQQSRHRKRQQRR